MAKARFFNIAKNNSEDDNNDGYVLVRISRKQQQQQQQAQPRRSSKQNQDQHQHHEPSMVISHTREYMKCNLLDILRRSSEAYELEMSFTLSEQCNNSNLSYMFQEEEEEQQ